MDESFLEKQAIEYLEQGKYTESISLYEQLIEARPEHVEYYQFLGLNYFLLDQEEEAQNIWISLLITENPENMNEEIENLAKILGQQVLVNLNNNNIAIAKKIYEKILEISPNYSILDFKSRIEQWCEQANLLSQKGNFQDAITLLKFVLEVETSLAKVWHDLGLTYYKIAEYELAIKAIGQSIKISPDNAQYHCNLGCVLEKIGNLDQAIESHERAIKYNNQLKEPYINLASIFLNQGKVEEARKIYNQYVSVNPQYFNLTHQLLIPFIYTGEQEIHCEREKFKEQLENIFNKLELTKEKNKKEAWAMVKSHHNFYLPYQKFNDLELNRKYGDFVSNVVQANYPQWCAKKTLPVLKKGEKIRIGYISAYLRNHSGGNWALGWLKNHNREEFEIYCYHLGTEVDLITEQFRSLSDFFYHIYWSLEAVCQQIIQDNLHILIYTDIGMDARSIPLAAMRLAPIQCNCWGHPVTSGLPTVDYYLSGELMEPENAQEHYSEELVFLPNVGLFFPKTKLPEFKKTRADLGFPDDAVIYVSCQTLFKYLPQHDYIFPSIASRVQLAKFAFVEYKQAITDKFKQRLKKAFAEFGLNSEDFCLFLPRVDFEEYLNRNAVSDIYLDTLGFSGGNTALQAVVCNLPIVTHPGEFMRGRLAYGILKMLGVEDTIAYSEREYIEIAVRLAEEPDWRRSIVEKIKANQDRIFEDKSCVEALEQFFKKIVNKSPSFE